MEESECGMLTWTDVLDNDDQADQHGDVSQQGEDSQDPEVPDENYQYQEGQEGEHVESRVHGERQNHCLGDGSCWLCY